MDIQNHDFEKINLEKLRKLLDSYWLNIEYEEKTRFSDKAKNNIISGKSFQVHCAHARVIEYINENGNKCRKYFQLDVFNGNCCFKIMIPKASLYSVCDSEKIELNTAYKKIEIKIDELKKLTIEQTNLQSNFML